MTLVVCSAIGFAASVRCAGIGVCGSKTRNILLPQIPLPQPGVTWLISKITMERSPESAYPTPHQTPTSHSIRQNPSITERLALSPKSDLRNGPDERKLPPCLQNNPPPDTGRLSPPTPPLPHQANSYQHPSDHPSKCIGRPLPPPLKGSLIKHHWNISNFLS